MRMAKPSENDIDAAGRLLQILDTIDSGGGGPWVTAQGPYGLEEALNIDDEYGLGSDFDCDDPNHLRGLYNSLAKLLREAGGFHRRVIGGMCYVICYDENQFLDPSKDYLALHPDARQGLELLAEHRANFLSRLERKARAAVAEVIEQSAARHLAEMQLGRQHESQQP